MMKPSILVLITLAFSLAGPTPIPIKAESITSDFPATGAVLAQMTKERAKQDRGSSIKTSTTVRDLNTIEIKIREGEFQFRGLIKRSASKQFMGSDGKVRVLLNPYDGHVIVFSEATGEKFYNYYIPPVSGVGEDPDTMCDPTKEPC
jgi:hypothetical protein